MISRLFAAVALLCVSVSAQVNVSPILQPHQTFVDASGAPCAGCSLFSYTAGTTTPTPTYTDSTGGVQNTNPIILSVQGGANVWVAKATAYKFVLKDTQGTTIWTVDNVTSPGGDVIVSNPSTTQTINQTAGTNLNVNVTGGGKFNYNGFEVLTTASGCTPSTCVQIAPQASQNVTQPAGTSLGVNVLNNTVYSNNYTTLQLAVAAACNGTVPGSVVLPVGNTVLAAPLIVPSNCTITGQGPQSTVSGRLISIGSSNVLLHKFTVQVASGDCIDITSPATNVTLDGIDVNTCANQGILLIGNSIANVAIQNGSVSKAGMAIPNGLSNAGIRISAAAVKNISIINEHIHDNSTGIAVVNSGVVGQDVSSINITDNLVYSNAYDGILVTIGNPNGGNINNVRVENNEVYCNGWPTNGLGFSPNCTPGFFQNGAAASGNGVGIDMIQNQGLTILRPIITGNQVHDNTYEAVAATTVYSPNVNTSGTSVTWVSGPKFNTLWSPGQWVIISGFPYQIASVPTNTTMTLKTSAGTQTNVITTMSAYMGAIISNNWSYNNGGFNSAGPGPAGSVGPGFYNASSDGNTYTGNISESSWLDGYINFYSSFLTYNGDMSFSDGRGAISGNSAGFNNIGGYGVSYNGVIVGKHDIATPVGFFVQNSQNTRISTTSNTANAPLTDTGFNTLYDNLAETTGVTITPASGVTASCSIGFVCTNRSGTLAISGGAFTSGSFVTLSWPATQQPRACTVWQNSGPTFLSIGLNPIPTTTGFGAGAGVSIAGQTFTISYNCPLP